MIAARLNYGQWLAALCIWREARGASITAKHAIMNVLINRMMDPKKRFADDLEGVVLQRKQFSSFNANDPNASKLPNAAPEGNPDYTAFIDCTVIAGIEPGAFGTDPTHGATNYHSIPPEGYTYKDTNGVEQKLMPPVWAKPEAFTVQIGQFYFYKL